MTGTPPLVTIGMPVYNGQPYVREAIALLLAQDYANFELVVSDNASTDGTSELVRQVAAQDSRVRYVRNSENIGAANNFNAVLQRARGKYFMWAAHDDRWNNTFVSALAESLDTARDAVLATPVVVHMNEDGSLRNDPVDRPACGTSGMNNLKILCADHSIGWFYGLYRTDWIRRHAAEPAAYPNWGNDALWLADVTLRYNVVGNDRAMMWKRLRRSSFAPQNARQNVAFWAGMFYHFARISFRRGKNRREQLKALGYTWAYVYRLGIRRSNLPRTLWRVARMLILAALTSIPAGMRRLIPKRRAADTPLVTSAADTLPHEANPAASGNIAAGVNSPVAERNDGPGEISKAA